MSSCVQKYTSLLRNELPKKLIKSVHPLMCSNSFKSRLSDKQSLLAPSVAPAGVHMLHSVSQINNVEKQDLMSLWPNVLKDLTDVELHFDKKESMEWFTKVLQYNVPSGKLIRGTLAVSAFRQLASADQLTDENIRLMQMLGWCIEILQASLIITDDIIDRSITRRNAPRWYLQNNVGRGAINDLLFLQQAVYQLLRRYFSDKSFYLDLIDTFHEITYKTLIGGSLDMNFKKKLNLNLFTIDRYNAIVKYKAAYYTFILPVTLAMHVAGIKDRECFKESTKIFLKMGKLFQIQDDYLDCYGHPETTGKIGTDIQEGKCSWFVVAALKLVTPAQRKILEECYGKNDPERVCRVKQLYIDLNLESTYYAYEKETFNVIKSYPADCLNVYFSISWKLFTVEKIETEMLDTNYYKTSCIPS